MELIIFIVLFALGLIFWKLNESRHYKSIKQREETYKNIFVINDTDARSFNLTQGELLYGSTAVSVDYFKKIVAGFINFFGGRITVYERVLDRARREATLRLKQQAAEKGYNCIVNLKIDTSSINGKKQDAPACADLRLQLE